MLTREYLRGKYHCTVDLLFDWFGLVCFENTNKNCQQSYSWFQTSQTEGQRYSDTSPFSIPCADCFGAIFRDLPPSPRTIFTPERCAFWERKICPKFRPNFPNFSDKREKNRTFSKIFLTWELVCVSWPSNRSWRTRTSTYR